MKSSFIFHLLLAVHLFGLSSKFALALEDSASLVEQPLWRFANPIHHLAFSPQGRYLAYLSKSEQGQEELRVLELKSQQIYKVSSKTFGPAFVWAPQGYRLFYRELERASGQTNTSAIKAYDCSLHQSVLLEQLNSASGFLTLNPRDLRLYTMTEQGIHLSRIQYPDTRLAKWQSAQRTQTGSWVLTQKGVLWLTGGGSKLQQMPDDASGIDSFALSPDGRSVAWSTSKGQLYVSHDGQAPTALGAGKDPHWHPQKKLLAFAGARLVGKVASSFDLRLIDEQGQGRWLTHSQHSNERWPHWHPNQDLLVYTKEKTTDLYLLDISYAKKPALPYTAKR